MGQASSFMKANIEINGELGRRFATAVLKDWDSLVSIMEKNSGTVGSSTSSSSSGSSSTNKSSSSPEISEEEQKNVLTLYSQAKSSGLRFRTQTSAFEVAKQEQALLRTYFTNFELTGREMLVLIQNYLLDNYWQHLREISFLLKCLVFKYELYDYMHLAIFPPIERARNCGAIQKCCSCVLPLP
jgi:hypothetical protein